MKAGQTANRAAAVPVEGAADQDAAPAARSGRARTGKIARLPHSVREALNERLRDGIPCAEIGDWLNSLPAVRKVLRERFDGSPIMENNISKWHRGGYLGWLENQENKEAMAIMAAGCRDIGQEDRDALAGQLSLGVAARMALKLRKYDDQPEGPLKTAAWRDLVWSLAHLRRGEFYAGKLRLEQDKLSSKEEESEAPLCAQERDEHFRKTFGLGGPHWNNFAKRWEGEGAAEMTEKQEVQILVVAELRRRKAARAAQAAPPPAAAEPAVEGLSANEKAPP